MGSEGGWFAGCRAMEVVLCYRASESRFVPGLKASARSGASRSVVLAHPFASNANGWGTHVRACSGFL
jgi:hypothetical protein